MEDTTGKGRRGSGTSQWRAGELWGHHREAGKEETPTLVDGEAEGRLGLLVHAVLAPLQQ